MKTTNLMQEITDCITGKNWISPPQHNIEGLQILGQMNDTMKAIYTLQSQKYDLLEDKYAKLTNLQMLHAIGPKVVTKTFGIGERSTFRMAVTTTEITQRNPNPQSILTTPYKEINGLRAECLLLAEELSTLQAMEDLELHSVIASEDLIDIHELFYLSDFSIATCGCLQRIKEEHKDVFMQQLQHIKKTHFLIVLKKKDELHQQFIDLLAEMKADLVTCVAGFIPDLATETTSVVFTPYKLDSPGIFHDEKVDAKDEEALARKERIELLFESIVVAGTEYKFENAEAHA